MGRCNHNTHKVIKLCIISLFGLISGAMTLAAETSQPMNPAASKSSGSAEKYSATLERSKKDSAIASGIVAQAQDLLAAVRSGRSSLVTPDASWGPARYKQISRSFGWQSEVVDGVEFLVLSDVHQTVAWSFNRAVLGLDLVYPWHGVGRNVNGLPYGNFRTDWGNNIVLPFEWLDSQKREAKRQADAKNGLLDWTGIPNDFNALSRLNLVWFDWFSSLATTHALLDMKQSPGGLENLLSYRLDSLQFPGSKTVNELMAVRKRCNETLETFARRDCLEELDLAFADYGRRLIAGKQLMVHGDARDPNWNSQTQQLEVNSVGLHGEWCAQDMVCEGIGPYGRGGLYLVCYRLDEPLPKKLAFPLKEQEARELSLRSGDIRSLQHVGFVIKVTQDAKAYDSPKMCQEGKNKILIEGRGSLTAKVLWNQVGSQYAVYEKPLSVGKSTNESKSGATAPAPVSMIAVGGTAKDSKSKTVIVIEAK
jgi:hypothetical protein